MSKNGDDPMEDSSVRCFPYRVDLNSIRMHSRSLIEPECQSSSFRWKPLPPFSLHHASPFSSIPLFPPYYLWWPEIRKTEPLRGISPSKFKQTSFKSKAKESNPDQNHDDKEAAKAKFKEAMMSYVDIKSHPKSQIIYAKLEEMSGKIKKLGYLLDASEQEQDNTVVNHHSDKLAVTFGIISLPKAAPVRVMKNLRVCRDCHTTMKFISMVERREMDKLEEHIF
ncbi:hypothetical protein HHK36_020388 [Tetracentron sinense]|uniref:DYW domain-containing protein n=1 Tax=Tetracentron sinense TaxID=13715 RepID=A0A834YX20_TETSI|nr:hypothetical protein HHK36_020388 [Tetracentron sinense]